MRIRIDDIKEEGLSVKTCEQVDAFPGLQKMAASGDLVVIQPVCIHARAIKVSDLVEVEGEAETVVRHECGRCLKQFESDIVVPFALTFTRELPEIEAEDEEEIELSAEDLGLIPFEGEEIDLRKAIEEQVIMSLPQRPLCSEDCKGLCPQCGTDLNQNSCQCEKPEFLNKFAALKNFRVEEKD